MAGGVFFKWKKPGGLEPDNARHVINTIAMNFFLPALCFKVIATAPIDKNTILLPVSAIITILSSLLFSYAVYSLMEKFIRISKKEKGVIILTASFGNVTFLGLPIMTSLYGNEAARYVLLYDLLATTPLLWFVGASIASSYGSGQKFTAKDSLKTLAKLPSIWALIAGFAVNIAGIALPRFAVKTLDLLSMPIVPLMMFSVGLALGIPKLKQALTVTPGIIIKLCVSPLIAFAAVSLLGMHGLAFKVSVMEAALPTMILTLVIVSQYKLDHELAALMILITTAMSFISLPVVSFLIRNF